MVGDRACRVAAMYVKSLTMKGFKSFASSTHLRLEPGITCIVGPNGSGKSNVVDALAWAMGEQGAKSLRGGSMEDVIFAGTAGRPPLGRAEVSLTIDNTDGALPIDYTEVTISRTMFRSGGSEYAINGTGLPTARHPGAAVRQRHRPRDARDRRPGPAGRGAPRDARGAARASSRRPPGSSSTASARSARCGSSRRWRPTSPASPT
jgi:energy-coupling factor transporter ATP-binding protein EcfA2